MKSLLNLGLRAKILLIAVAVTLLSLGAVLAISSHLFAEAYLGALQSRSSAIAQGLKLQMDRILQLGIQIENLSGFDKQCKSVVDSYQGIDFALIARPDGTVLFSSDATHTGQPLADAVLLQAVQNRTETTVEYTQDGMTGYGSVVPIVTRDEAHVASVVIGLSARVLDAKEREMRTAFIGVGLLMLVIGAIALIVALSHFISRPLRQLIGSIQRVSSNTGDLGQRIALDTTDELGTLARAFNGLMQSLQDTTVTKSSLEAAYGALQESEEKYRELVSNANAIILRLDMLGCITYFNEYAERFFGYSSAEILGKSVVGTILPPFDSTTGRDLSSMVAAVLADPAEFADNENENITRDGRRVHVRWANRVILDGRKQPIGILSIGQDITEKRLIDKELERYRNHLEELVRERTTALSVAKEAAEAANRAKTIFLANMSHELRTPMNGIMGMTDLALLKATDPKQIHYLKTVMQASQQLLAVIANILDITKIESERLSLEQTEFRLGEVLDHVRGLLTRNADEKGLKLQIDVPASIASQRLKGDALRLGQVLINLTGNAVKFTERGTVTLRAATTREDAGQLQLLFEVEDTGIGIAAQDQRRLFTAFEQADNSMTRKYGGTGLGLAISKRLVNLMGGDIGVESTLGKGSRFWFTVTLGKGQDGAVADAVARHSPEAELKRLHAGKRILVAEDEPVNQEVTRCLLEEAGLAVDIAGDGVEAVARFEQGGYALILMDMQMPRLNGLEATQQIRLLPQGNVLPIIAMTANAFTEDRARCLDVGMNDFITKPVDPNLLYATLLKWLGQP
ncbi:MAG: ATP-binding protein [Pseudomonadota bacterium]